MKRFFSLQLFETVLIMICITGFLMVPERLVPRAIWPLVAGILFIVMYVLQQFTPHTLYQEKFGALMGGTMLTVMGITLLVNKSAYLLGLGIGLGLAMFVGIVWTVAKTRKDQA